MSCHYSSKRSGIRTRRAAEVSSGKDCCAVGVKGRLRLWKLEWSLTSSKLCFVNPSSFGLIPFEVCPPLVSSLQLFSCHLSTRQFFKQRFSAVLNLFASLHFSSTPSSPLSISSQLFFACSYLFATLLNGSHLCPPLFSTPPPFLTSFELHSPFVNPAASSQLFSMILTLVHLFSTLLNPSESFSLIATLSSTLSTSSCTVFSTLLRTEKF